MSRLFDSEWGAALSTTVVLLVASLVPSPFERHAAWKRLGPDKVLHLVGHAGYAVTLADALSAGRYSRRQAAVLAVCLSTAHGLVSNTLQRWVPGRGFEWGDVVAGFLGSVVAAVGWYVRGVGNLSVPTTPDEASADRSRGWWATNR